MPYNSRWDILRSAVDTLHVVPMDDTGEHQTHMKCWCEPQIMVAKQGYFFTHNAGDGRENYEWDSKKRRN